MSNIPFLFLPLAFSSLPAVLPFVSPSSQVTRLAAIAGKKTCRLGTKRRPPYEQNLDRIFGLV